MLNRAPTCILTILTPALAAMPAHAQATKRPGLSPQQQRNLLVEPGWPTKISLPPESPASSLAKPSCSGQPVAHASSPLPRNPHAEQISAALKTVTFKVTLHNDNSIEATPLNLATLAKPKVAVYQDVIIARLRRALRMVIEGRSLHELRAPLVSRKVQSTMSGPGSRYSVVYSAGTAGEDVLMKHDFLIDDVHFRALAGLSGSYHPSFISTLRLPG